PQTLGEGTRVAREMNGGPAEHAGGDVADAANRVAPATVGVLMLREPPQTARDKRVVGSRRWDVFLDKGQSTHRRRRREGGRGEFTAPGAVCGPLGEEVIPSVAVGMIQPCEVRWCGEVGIHRSMASRASITPSRSSLGSWGLFACRFGMPTAMPTA